ncbi:MAG: nicotinate-nucleotide adenylyltransferase [Burkholderiales bacterium]
MSVLNPIGILGGTFDPVHYGHLALATAAAEQLKLSEVRLIPIGTPPHRAAPVASSQARVDMLRLALADKPRLRLDEREIARSGPSYTVDTLHELRRETGAARALVLLLGADAFAGLATWHRWQELFALAHIAVAQRPGTTLKNLPPVLARVFEKRRAQTPQAASGNIVVVEITPQDIAASNIRARLAAGKDAHDLLPATVLDYIRTNHLYTGGG